MDQAGDAGNVSTSFVIVLDKARYRPKVSDQAGLVFREPLC
jgi:hypothetical protein